MDNEKEQSEVVTTASLGEMLSRLPLVQPNQKKDNDEKKDIWVPYTFDLPSHPYQMDVRAKVEATPHQYVVYDGLRRLSEFLLMIDDHDLVRKVCQIEESDYERKGIGTLIRLPGVPRDYPGGQEYQAFLSHLEKLMVIHMSARSGTYSYYKYYREERYGHPYSLLIYVLALTLLGKHARYIGHIFLDYAAKLEHDCPGLGYVYGVYRSFDMFYRRFEEEEE